MKIKFIISKLVNIEPSIIVKKIKCRLSESGYSITYQDDYKINFNNNFWTIGSRTKAFGKVDEGKFQIITLESETKIILSYYFSFVPTIFFTTLFILGSVIVDYHIMYFIPIFLIIDLLRFDNVKSVGKKMINDILS